MANKRQAELAELGMTEEDLAARQDRVNAILGKGEVLETKAEIIKVKSDGAKFLPMIPEDKMQTVFAGDGLMRITEEIKRMALADPAAGDPTLLMQTAKGRKDIIHLARMVTSSRVYLDDLGKETAANLKALPRLIDANRKTMRDKLDALADAIRKPVTDDEERVAAHEARLQAIRSIPLSMQAATSAEVAHQIEELRGMPLTAEEWEEFFPIAKAEVERTLQVLSEAFTAKKTAEDNAAELERLRIAAIDRGRQDAENQRVQAAAESARRKEQERVENGLQAALGCVAEARREAELAQQRAAQAEAEAAKLKEENLCREIKEYVAAELVEVGAQQIQRRFNLSYGAAEEMLNRMEADGVIGQNVNGKRKVLRAIPEPVPTPETVQQLKFAEAQTERDRERLGEVVKEISTDHRKHCNREALEDISNAIPGIELAAVESREAISKAIATAIIRGQIRHVSINY